jgi:hypothetical protein
VTDFSQAQVTLSFVLRQADVPEFLARIAGAPPALPTLPAATNSFFIQVGPTRQFKDPAAAILALAPGGTMVIDDGRYMTPFDIPPELAGITIKSATIGKAVLDGQGGAGAGHRLAWGKGVIHCRAPNVTFIGLSFVNGGGADKKADGEAGLYIGNPPPGLTLVQKCSFDGCENGVFVADGPDDLGHNVKIAFEDCEFGKTASNGVSQDGLAHDVYLRGLEGTITRSTFFGNRWGNLIKSYLRDLKVSDSWFSAGAGRFLDLNHGGKLLVTNSHVQQEAGASNQLISYGVLSLDSGAGGPALIDSTSFVISRYDTQIWVIQGQKLTFMPTCSWTFSKLNAVPPSIGAKVADTVIGLPANPSGDVPTLAVQTGPSRF